VNYRRFFIIYTLLFLLGLTQTAMADGKTEVKEMMKEKIGKVTSIIQDKTIAKNIRDTEVDALVRPLFDFGLMGRLSLGKTQWKKLTTDERREFSRLFEERVMNSYMSKLDLYTDEVVIISDAIKVKSRIHLPTRLVRKNEKREILYKFYKSKKRSWLIYDVDILGVSIIQTYRKQFSGILKEETFAVLLEKLKTSES